MKNIVITNIFLKRDILGNNIISPLDAIRLFRKELTLSVMDSKKLYDDLRTIRPYEIPQTSEGEYKLHIIEKVFDFDIVKSNDEIYGDAYQQEKLRKLSSAAKWYQSLSAEEKEHFITLQQSFIPTA